MQQPLHRAIMEHRPSISAAPAAHHPTTPAIIPMHQNILSRALVNTIGRLGRWKRVNSRPAAVNPRHGVPASLTVCGDNSAFDLELNMTDDLLTVRGGVEQLDGPGSACDHCLRGLPVHDGASEPAERSRLRAKYEIRAFKPGELIEQISPIPTSESEPHTSIAISSFGVHPCTLS